MTKLFILSLSTVLILGIGCTTYRSQRTIPERNANDTSATGTPDWILQGNIYEVNIRQYTQEGTFKAFQKHLGRLKNMGVQTLWFMPVNPISKKDRKGTLGSYYAVADYTSVNPEFGTMSDWKELVEECHEKGMKVIIDWVPNHTGADHRWLTQHPDFFAKDSTGKFIAPFDWTDVRKLNYSNTVLKDSMIGAMKFWINKTDIDGFRCDVAGEVPDDFWTVCIKILRRQKDIFMLAEGDKPSLLRAGFDASYPWNMFNIMKQIAKGDRPAFAIDSIRTTDDAQLPAKGMRMYFTSNHDENSWNKADFETMPGASHAPFAVLTQTMVRGVPLIYSGQEEPVLKALQFFEKDPINFGTFQREKFYKTLLQLRKNNAALAADASFKKVSVGDENSVYSYVREKDGKKVFVILNLTAKEQTIEVHEPMLLGKTYNVFMEMNETLINKKWNIKPWGFAVYEYK